MYPHYDHLTQHGITLFNGSSSLLAAVDPELELFGIPTIGVFSEYGGIGLEAADVCAIDYESGEVVRSAFLPSDLILTKSGRDALSDLKAIKTLTDIHINSAEMRCEMLSQDWAIWIESLHSITGLILNGFTDVSEFANRACRLEKLIRLNIGNAAISLESIAILASLPNLQFLYVHGFLSGNRTVPSFRNEKIIGLYFDLVGATSDAKFIASAFPSLRLLRLSPSWEGRDWLASRLPNCRVEIEGE